MVQRLLNLKQKILKLFHSHYVSETFQKTGQMIIWKKQDLMVTLNDFSTDYNAINKSDILDIQKYLMKKNNMV